MTQTGYTNAVVDTMLGWLKGLASWVLRLFNLSAGGSPLKFLADNWLKLLIFLLILGVAADVIIWLIRWRPHWVWFRKKRVIIDDKNFFAHEHDAELDEDWRPAKNASPRRKPRRNWEDSEFVVRSTVVRRKEPKRRYVKSMQIKDRQAAKAENLRHMDVFQDDLFNVNAKQKFSDKYEDEVFNVDNLTKSAPRYRTASRNAPQREAYHRNDRRR